MTSHECTTSDSYYTSNKCMNLKLGRNYSSSVDKSCLCGPFMVSYGLNGKNNSDFMLGVLSEGFLRSYDVRIQRVQAGHLSSKCMQLL